MTDDMNDMISEFLVECSENLEEFEVNLLELEKTPEKAELVDSMFRMVHSIKGASGFLAFSNLETLTHKAENVLGLIRDDKGSVSSDLISTFLEVCDAVKDMFQSIEDQGNDGDKSHEDLIAKLKIYEDSFNGLVDAVNKEAEASSKSEESETNDTELDDVQLEALKALGMAPAESTKEEEPQAEAKLDAVQLEALKALGMAPESKEPELDAVQREALESLQGAAAKAEDPKEEKQKTEQPAAKESRKVQKKETIRVDVDTLNELVNFAGELVLVRNQLLELSKQNDAKVFTASFNELNLITGEIQRSLMTTRMQPISSIWGKIPRVVRDLSNLVNKQVAIEMFGENTELDRTVLEAISDPMTHIIRNCVDHGLETPEERVAAGKPEKGMIRLEAEHRGNWIHIDISDDGRGISLEKLKKKALEKELYTQEQLDNMSEKEVLNLIFHAGFSTKEQVSNISGRGVGMDVIRSNITKINGNVDIFSEEGVGTTLKIRLPLTLAIIPAVIVSISGERYAIPQSSVQEVACASAQEIESFDNIGGQKFTRLRGEILPLVFGSEFLNLETEKEKDNMNYVVVNADGYCYGLVIDSVLDIVEIVVKPLDSESENFSYYAGATIMGDGKVAMILDALNVAQLQNIEQKHEDHSSNVHDIRVSSGSSDNLSLIFELSDAKNYIIPLNKTNRIEEISKTDIEERNIGKFAKFNEGLIRILDLDDLLNVDKKTEEEEQSNVLRVLYYEVDGHGIGVNVGSKQRLHQTGFELEASDGSEFIVGTTLIDNEVLEVVDLDPYIAQIVSQQNGNNNNFDFSDLGEFGDKAYTDVNNQILSFRLDDLLFGIKLNAISEIIPREEVTVTPGANDTIKGLLNLRGNILVSKSLPEILELKTSIVDPAALEEGVSRDLKSIILSSQGQELCLQINEIDEILTLTAEDFNTVPTNIPGNIQDYLSGVYKLDKELLLLIDEDKLVAVNDNRGVEI